MQRNETCKREVEFEAPWLWDTRAPEQHAVKATWGEQCSQCISISEWKHHKVFISLCQQAQRTNRLNQHCVSLILQEKVEGRGTRFKREFVYQPFSKALRMATSMSWCSSELMWNTVICLQWNKIALINRFPQAFSTDSTAVWYVISSPIKANRMIFKTPWFNLSFTFSIFSTSGNFAAGRMGYKQI